MASYRPPGVTVKFVENPSTALLPTGLRIPCIIATGLTTKLVKNVQVTRGTGGGGTADTIPDTSLAADVSSVVSVGDFPDLKQYVENTDWRQVGNTILWISNGQAPTGGNAYYVTYREPKETADYNSGVLYTSLQDVANDFGDPLISGVLNPITAAAKLCFDNGAPVVMLIQPTTGSQSDLQTAIDSAKNEDIDVLVVPQACNTTLDNYVKNHVLTESSPQVRHERVWFRSSDGMSDAVTTVRATAVGVKHERVTVLAPPAFVSTFKDATTTLDQDLLLPSGYLAAAYAGLVCNPVYDAATPLTRKSLVSVKNLSTFDYTQVNKDQLGGDGVTVIENNKGDIRIRHALTTDPTNVNTLTQSVVFIKDNIRKDLRGLLDSAYIGSKIDDSLKSRVAATVGAFLRQKVRDTIIKDYRNVKVNQDANDPRILTVTFDLSPVYPAEFLDITISLFVS